MRALDGTGDTFGAIEAAKSMVADIGDDTAGLWLLARTISELRLGLPLASVAKQALDRVVAAEPDATYYAEVRFRVLHDLLGEHEQAEALALEILDRMPPGHLNNWCWGLMTDPRTRGHYDRLAVYAADRMLQNGVTAGYAWDTVALAMFLGGRLDEAIHCARRSLEDGADPDYQLRLSAYVAAKAAAAQHRGGTADPTKPESGR